MSISVETIGTIILIIFVISIVTSMAIYKKYKHTRQLSLGSIILIMIIGTLFLFGFTSSFIYSNPDFKDGYAVSLSNVSIDPHSPKYISYKDKEYTGNEIIETLDLSKNPELEFRDPQGLNFKVIKREPIIEINSSSDTRIQLQTPYFKTKFLGVFNVTSADDIFEHKYKLIVPE